MKYLTLGAVTALFCVLGCGRGLNHDCFQFEGIRLGVAIDELKAVDLGSANFLNVKLRGQQSQTWSEILAGAPSQRITLTDNSGGQKEIQAWGSVSVQPSEGKYVQILTNFAATGKCLGSPLRAGLIELAQ
ncbi:MAG: hypothetical protein AB1486_20710 [Planctomycetota bacterium]